MRGTKGRAFRLGLLLVLSAASGTPGAWAQLWRGPAAIEVKAEDKGKAATGGEVRLEFLDMEPPAGPAPVKLDSRGRAVVGSLAEGRWRLEVSREGSMTYRAEIFVRRDGKPGLIEAVQHNVPGAVSMMEVKLSRARGGVATSPPQEPQQIAAMPKPVEPARPAPTPVRPAPAPPPQSVPAADEEPLNPAPVTAPVKPAPVAPAPTTPTPPAKPAPSVPAPTRPTPEPRRPVTVLEPPVEAPAPVPERPAEPAVTPTPSAPPVPSPPPATTPTPAPPRSAPVPMPTPAPRSPQANQPTQPTPAPPRPIVPDQNPPSATPPPAPVQPTPGSGVLKRSFKDRTCMECKPGEASLTVDLVAAPSAAGCGEALRDNLLRLDTSAMGEGCHLLRLDLPDKARFIGYRYEAQDGSGQGSDCLAGKGCPAGGRWPVDPVLRRDGAGKTTVVAAFENRGDRERRAVMTIYFKEGGGADAPRPMIPSKNKQ